MSKVFGDIGLSTFLNSSDSSKKIGFDLTGCSPTTTTTLAFTNSGTTSIPLPAGTLVTLNATQTLTNKTMTDSSNNITATGLNTTTTTVLVSSVLSPVLGNCLTAASSTTISWFTIGLDNAMTTRGDMVYQDSNNQTNRLPIGTQSQYLMVTSGASPNDVNWNNYYIPARMTIFFDDCMNATIGMSRCWLYATSGTGIATVLPVTKPSGNWLGLVNMNVTSSGDRVSLNVLNMPVGIGTLSVEYTVNMPVLSNGTDTYIFRGGLGNNNTSDFTNGVYFEYNTSSGVGTGLTWLCKTASGSVRTTTDSLVTVTAGTWYRLGININSLGTSVDFLINGSVVTTTTTNIPTGTSQRVNAYLQLSKTVGTALINFFVDYYYLNYQLNSNRY